LQERAFLHISPVQLSMKVLLKSRIKSEHI
jgi:hypothetical protein